MEGSILSYRDSEPVGLCASAPTQTKDVQITHISHLKPHHGGDTLTSINEMLKYTYPLEEEETGVQDVQEY